MRIELARMLLRRSPALAALTASGEPGPRSISNELRDDEL